MKTDAVVPAASEGVEHSSANLAAGCFGRAPAVLSREALRAEGMRLLDEGVSYRVAADMLGIRRGTLAEWRKYHKEGRVVARHVVEWSEAEINRALELFNTCRTREEALSTLRHETGIYRSMKAAVAMLRNYGLKVGKNNADAVKAAVARRRETRAAQVVTRPCLMCLKAFPSEHAGNRVCQACKKTEAWS